jgi:hypothetical protein
VGTFDEAITDRLSLALAESGVLSHFRALCLRYPLKEPLGTERLTSAALARALEAAGTRAKSLAKFQTVQFGHETVDSWTWFGVVVIQNSRRLELMFEGSNDVRAAGSTLHDLCDTAARLRPGSVESGPPYPRPYYDPDHLGELAADLVALVAEMQAVLRRTRGLLAP